MSLVNIKIWVKGKQKHSDWIIWNNDGSYFLGNKWSEIREGDLPWFVIQQLGCMEKIYPKQQKGTDDQKKDGAKHPPSAGSQLQHLN